MDDDKAANSKDLRQMCKYGAKCYQKNPEHTKRYKHPAKRDPTSPNVSPTLKKMKLDVRQEKKRDTPSPQLPAKTIDKDKRDPTSPNISPNQKRMKLDVQPEKKRDTPSPQPLAKTVEIDSVNSDDEQQDGSLSPSILSEAVDTSREEKSKDQRVPASPAHTSSPDDNSNDFHNVPSDAQEFIKEKFLVQMPADFYSFWDFCCSISKGKNTMDVFKGVNMILVGPFDVLNGSLPKRSRDADYYVHWRYFYDPPEFQTVLMSPEKSNFHMGYYRDSPADSPCFIASNEASNNCQIKPVAENIFGAMLCHLENTKKKSPFTSIACQKIITPLKEWATKHKFTLETYSELMKKRQKLVIAKTFHGAGIVVPVDKKTSVGYRPISENNARLKVLMSRVPEAENEAGRVAALAALQPIITNANLATDECDFGTGLELGLDFFCMGEKAFNSTVKSLMCVAYSMVDRDAFGKIIVAHLDNRRKGCKLSIADL